MILLLAVEADKVEWPPGATATLILEKIVQDLARHDPKSNRAYSQVGRGSQVLGRWLYLVGGNSEVTQKAEAALDAMYEATDTKPERDLPEEPQAGDMTGWPAGKIVVFDHEGRSRTSYSPQAYHLRMNAVHLGVEEAKRIIAEQQGKF